MDGDCCIYCFFRHVPFAASGEEEKQHAAGEAEPAACAESDEAWPRWDMEMSDGDEVALARDGAIVFVRPDGKWQYLIPCEETIASAGADRSHALWRYPPVAGLLGEEAPEDISALKAADILRGVRRDKMERYSDAVSGAGRAARDLARRAGEMAPREAEEDETTGCRTAVTERGGV